jgi:arylsulfatase A-like enzyme
VGMLDLFYKILSASSLPVPASLAHRQDEKNNQPVVGEFYNFDLGVHRVIYDNSFKYLYYQHQKDNELYDLANDPKERHNLAKKRPLQIEEFNRKLKLWQVSHKPLYLESLNEEKNVSQDYIDKLKALGYIE